MPPDPDRHLASTPSTGNADAVRRHQSDPAGHEVPDPQVGVAQRRLQRRFQLLGLGLAGVRARTRSSSIAASAARRSG